MDYQQTEARYLKSAQRKSIPVKLRQKIQLVVTLIKGQHINLENIIDIPLKEIDRLSALRVQQQKKIAIELMHKAINTKVILEAQFPETACLIKKEGFFNQWFQTFIHFHNKILLFTILVGGHEGKHLYQFGIGQITLSEKFKKFRNRKGFVLTCKGKQYSLAFSHQSICDKVYARMLKLIEKENNSFEFDRNSNTSIPFRQIVGNNLGAKPEKWSHIVPFQNQDNSIKQDQSQCMLYSLQECERKYKRQSYTIVQSVRQIIDQQEPFKLIKNMKNGQILVRKDNKCQVKVMMLLHCDSPLEIMEHYMNQSKWNPQIEEQIILAKTQKNGYIVSKKIKSNSKVFRNLHCIFERKVMPYAGSIYINDQTIDHDQYQPGFVKAKLNTITQISSRKPREWMLITVSELFCQSYFNNFYGKSMLIKYMQSLEHLQLYIDSRSAKRSTEKKKPLFQLECLESSVINSQNQSLTNSTHSLPPTHCLQQQSINYLKHAKSSIFSASVKQQESKQRLIYPLKEISDFRVNEEINAYSDENQQQINPNEQKPNHCFFHKILLKNQYCIPTKQYFKAIEQKQHQKYYLSNKFQVNILKCQKFAQYSQNFIYQTKEWIINKQRQLIYVNKQLLEAQKGVLSFVIKQIGSNFFSGKSIMNMSLPVDVFSKQSFLEFLANSFGFAPVYFPRAAEINDPIQQMKLVTLFMINSPTLSLKIEKPFNPILGQTFTAYLGGIPIFFQQISHHPPISAFLMKTDTFMFHGQIKMSANIGLNSATGMNLGFLNIQFFNTGCHFKIFEPQVEIAGLIYGDRKFKLTGKGIVTQQKNSLYTQIQFGSNKNNAYDMKHTNLRDLRSCSVNGIICKVGQSFYEGFNRMIGRQKKSKYFNIKENQIKEKITEVHGQFISTIFFDGKEVKKQGMDLPFKAAYYQNPLPSDCNFRQDILYRRIQENKKSQQEKQKLQNLQRSQKQIRSKKRKNNNIVNQ